MQFWEDAVRGSSALQAGLRRRLQDECTVALGQHCASVFWDMEKFYDSIDWVRVMDWAAELGLPAPLVQVAMTIHMAPIIIKVGKIVAPLHRPSNSLVAGCISAIWLSMVMVCTILSRTHEEGTLRSRNFFDDIVSRAEGAVPDALARSRRPRMATSRRHCSCQTYLQQNQNSRLGAHLNNCSAHPEPSV